MKLISQQGIQYRRIADCEHCLRRCYPCVPEGVKQLRLFHHSKEMDCGKGILVGGLQ